MGLRDIWIKIKGKDDSKPALQSATRGVGSLGKSAASMGKLFKGSFSIALKAVKLLSGAIVGAVSASAGIVRVGYNFRKAMALVNTMLPDGSRSIKKFSEEVINLSMKLGVAKDELALGLYQVLSAGVPEDNAIAFLADAAQSAVGGASNIDTTVKALTKTLEAFGASAGTTGDVADALFMTVKQGQISFDELAAGIGGIAGIAASAGVGMDELLGSIAKVTKTEEPRRAITSLRAAILAIVAPSDALNKEFKKLGISGQDLVAKNGLAGAFQVVAEMAGDSAEKAKELIGMTEALPAFLALTGKNAKSTADSIANMAQKSGEAGKAFAKMDVVRGWPRLWQTISGQITKIGVTMDTKLNPIAGKIGVAIAKWGESKQFRGILDTMDEALDKAIKVGTALGAGGESRAAAQDYIKSFTQPMVDALVSGGGKIGEAVAVGMIKGMYKAGGTGGSKIIGSAVRGAVSDRTGSDVIGKKAGGIAGFVAKAVSQSFNTFARLPNYGKFKEQAMARAGQAPQQAGSTELFERMTKAVEGVREDLKK